VCSVGRAPPRDKLRIGPAPELADERQTMTVYVVARTGPADPDPLHGVTLQVRDPRRNPDNISATPWTWNVARLTAGTPCPGVPNSLCPPLS
jgi:hypothetical protein